MPFNGLIFAKGAYAAPHLVMANQAHKNLRLLHAAVAKLAEQQLSLLCQGMSWTQGRSVDREGTCQALAGSGQLPKPAQHVAEVDEGDPHLEMIGAVSRLLDHQGTLLTGAGTGQVPKLLPDEAEVAQSARDVGVVGAVGGLPDREGALKMLAGTGQLSKPVQHRAEAVEGAGDVGVVGAVGGLPDREGALKMLAGVGPLPKLSQHAAEAVEGAGDVGVVGAVGGLPDRESLVQDGTGSSQLGPAPQVDSDSVQQRGDSLRGGVTGSGIAGGGLSMSQQRRTPRPATRILWILGQGCQHQPNRPPSPLAGLLRLQAVAYHCLDQPMHRKPTAVTPYQRESVQRCHQLVGREFIVDHAGKRPRQDGRSGGQQLQRDRI